jgi:hypothetical protein
MFSTFGWVILSGMATGLISYTAVAAQRLTKPQRRLPLFEPAQAGFENIRFPARGEALNIAAWYIPAQSATRAVIIAHGIGGCRWSTRGRWRARRRRAVGVRSAIHLESFGAQPQAYSQRGVKFFDDALAGQPASCSMDGDSSAMEQDMISALEVALIGEAV